MAKETESTAKPKKKRRVLLPVLCVAIILSLLLIAFIVFYIYMRRQTNPDRIMNQYITAFMSKDISVLHTTIGFGDSPFMDADSFGRAMEECHKYSTITDYSLTKYPSTEPDRVEYVLQYWSGHHQNPYTQTLVLKKSDINLYFLFDNWIIDNSEFLAEGCKLNAPSGAEVSLDGKALSGEWIQEKTDDSCTYQIGSLFIGTHELKVQARGFEPYSTTITLQDKDYSAEALYNVTPSMLSLTDETRTELEDKAKNLLKDTYSFALSGKGFDELAEKYTFEDSSRSLLEQDYNALISNNISSSAHLTDVNFTEIKNRGDNTYAEDRCYAITVSTNAAYTVSSEIQRGTPADDGTEGNTPAKKRTANSNSSFSTDFHYRAGEWSIHSTTIFNTCIYYIRR